MTFSSYKSYVKAVSAAFVEIKTAKFTKKVSEMFSTSNCFTAFQLKSVFYFADAELSQDEGNIQAVTLVRHSEICHLREVELLDETS